MGVYSRICLSAVVINMVDEGKISIKGEVVEVLPNAMFRVKLENGGRVVLAHTSGKMRMRRIKVIAGDWVGVELSVYDLGKGRIIFRERSEREQNRGR